MSKEQSEKPAYLTAAEVFGFTDQERAAYRVTQERFQQILDDQRTTVHSVREDENNYGEFLFVTTSRPAPQGRALVTFYGLGHHWVREQWITDTWSWYEANPSQQ